MLLYLLTARYIHVKFFLSDSDGIPVENQEVLPPETNQIASAIDNMSFVDEDLFILRGWVFLRSDPENPEFEKFIILKSDMDIYFYSIETTPIIVKLPPFSAIVSKEFVQPGTYRIGFLFRNKTNKKEVYYSHANKIIVRTPNSVQLEDYKK
jgi:hypothetical protein